MIRKPEECRLAKATRFVEKERGLRINLRAAYLAYIESEEGDAPGDDTGAIGPLWRECLRLRKAYEEAWDETDESSRGGGAGRTLYLENRKDRTDLNRFMGGLFDAHRAKLQRKEDLR